MKNFNFAFWGTPLISSQTLEILKNNGYIPLVIITSPDKPSGRGLEMKETPVSVWAKENNIKCLKPEKINDEFRLLLSSYPILLNIVVAYGKILPEDIISSPKFGTINIHYSLLPKYRGASPLESALLNGDDTTGISIQQMAFKLDSGPILASKEIKLELNETKEEIKNKLINIGGNLLSEIIPNILERKILPKPQNESEATYCSKITKADGEIDLNSNPKENYNKYRAYNGWPGTYLFVNKNDKKIRVKINHATYENNLFNILKVTPEGKKTINYEDFLRQISISR